MDKVRFACPRCQTIMQTGAEKVGYDVACPHCAHRFQLVGSNDLPTDETRVSDPVADSSRQSSGSSSSGSEDSGGFYISDQTKPPGSAPVLSRSPVATSQAGFSCPYCQTVRPPIWKSEVSTIGWIVFAILLVTTCFFCFIGLFVRDRYRVCSQCKIRLD